ncbi:hypothetical protein [Limoniibacter endophyticus]|uniref:Uncharacterized protein n=1 Tax=Limoniibacter endophyticus TaxID=1565040 RepID=A0A8J3DT14_9HYPH|nr:hypothetical protein [Limoniibacter endophyticus]GHC79536.1 hypothetical protein GCM10010136_32170 [Limoniibacter endophyticus]
MRDKFSDRGVKMSVTRIEDPTWLGEEAKRMSAELLRKEHRGPGDTIEAAADRLQTRLRVPSAIILQCWNRPPREMKVSRWMAVFRAHLQEFGNRAEANYEEKRNDTQAHPVLAGLADFIAGKPSRQPEA